MKFSEYAYTRPEIKEVQENARRILSEMEGAADGEGFVKAMDEYIALRNHVETMFTLASIRQSIDTRDEFYDKEQAYMDEMMPHYQELVTDFYKVLISSPYRKDIEAKHGKHLLDLAELSIKTFKPEIIEELQLENRLCTEYSKLVASAAIMFRGEERNLSGLVPFMEDPDRATRKEAYEAYSGFFAAHEAEFDRIYDELVKTRDTIARKLGFENFVPVGYARMLRTEYGPEMVKVYRDAVREHIVPLSVKLKQRQARRLSLDSLKYYDEPVQFTSGNATPKGSPEWIVDNAKKMYSELSPETDEFFKFMTDKELLDLVTKKGKQAGGYCTYISEYKSPFIFSNFNGTSGDIDVMTHEAGHAFQVFRSRGYEVPEYGFPTSEACEIHSMSMEFLTWPWMDLFFKEDTGKYKFNHLQDSLLFLPYGVSVDEFQHFVYENPGATPEERKSKWREIEKKYLPVRDYEDNDLYNRGGFFFKQLHIFVSPFYYIDYTLAQVCAFQFFNRAKEDRETAWKDYLRLCDKGGSMPFLELVKVAGLKSPFEKETIPEVIPGIEEYLDSVDDMRLN
jgi:M3 family oligoendopeptidase